MLALGRHVTAEEGEGALRQATLAYVASAAGRKPRQRLPPILWPRSGPTANTRSHISCQSASMRTCSPTCQARAKVAALAENFRKLSANARAVIGDSIDRTAKVIGDQHRAVLKDQQVSWASKVIVIFDEARDERIDRFHGAVLVE